jgi:hypothetical protein
MSAMHRPASHSPWTPPPPMPPTAQAHLVIDMKRHWLVVALALFIPTIVINGHQTLGRWGRNVIPLPAGRHHLHIHLPYFLPPRYGPADLTIWLQPGTALEVEYRAPVWAFSRGAFGPAPQPWNGKGWLIPLLVILVGMLVFLWVLIIAVFVSIL